MKTPQGIRNGEECARVLAQDFGSMVSALGEQERIFWWAGFMASLAGMCAASVGPEALNVIQEMVFRKAREASKDNQH